MGKFKKTLKREGERKAACMETENSFEDPAAEHSRRQAFTSHIHEGPERASAPAKDIHMGAVRNPSHTLKPELQCLPEVGSSAESQLTDLLNRLRSLKEGDKRAQLPSEEEGFSIAEGYAKPHTRALAEAVFGEMLVHLVNAVEAEQANKWKNVGSLFGKTIDWDVEILEIAVKDEEVRGQILTRAMEKKSLKKKRGEWGESVCRFEEISECVFSGFLAHFLDIAEIVRLSLANRQLKKMGDSMTKVREALFEFYDLRDPRPGINPLLVPEDFFSQLHTFSSKSRIKVIDLHGPSYDLVDSFLDKILQDLGIFKGRWGHLRGPSIGYMASEEPARKGYPLKPARKGYPLKEGSSRYRFANRAAIWSPRENDTDYKIVFRVCPHIMQSLIASAIVYCPPPFRSERAPALGDWDGRLFASAASFGAALREAEGMLAGAVQQQEQQQQQQPDGRLEVRPLWRREKENRVFLLASGGVGGDEGGRITLAEEEWIQQQVEGLKEKADLEAVELIQIPPPRDTRPLRDRLVSRSMFIFRQPPGKTEESLASEPISGDDFGIIAGRCLAGFQSGFRDQNRQYHSALLSRFLKYILLFPAAPQSSVADEEGTEEEKEEEKGRVASSRGVDGEREKEGQTEKSSSSSADGTGQTLEEGACSDTGEATEKGGGPVSEVVREVLFEYYEPKKTVREINRQLILEEFLTQLHNIRAGCPIKFIDLHGPSYDLVDSFLDRLLLEFGIIPKGPRGGNSWWCTPGSGYLKSNKPEAKGYPMNSSSRYRFANRAAIWSLRENDTDYKIVFRVCPHIMQSMIASAIVYCSAPATPKPEGAPALGDWDGRLFASAASFGAALREAEGILAGAVQQQQQQPDDRLEVRPLWRREKENRVFLLASGGVGGDEGGRITLAEEEEEWIQQQVEGLKEKAELEAVELIQIPPPTDEHCDSLRAFLWDRLVSPSLWISRQPPGEEESPVSGDELGHFIRLCLAGFRNGFRSMTSVLQSYSALVRNCLAHTDLLLPPGSASCLADGAAEKEKDPIALSGGDGDREEGEGLEKFSPERPACQTTASGVWETADGSFPQSEGGGASSASASAAAASTPNLQQQPSEIGRDRKLAVREGKKKKKNGGSTREGGSVKKEILGDASSVGVGDASPMSAGSPGSVVERILRENVPLPADHVAQSDLQPDLTDDNRQPQTPQAAGVQKRVKGANQKLKRQKANQETGKLKKELKKALLLIGREESQQLSGLWEKRLDYRDRSLGLVISELKNQWQVYFKVRLKPILEARAKTHRKDKSLYTLLKDFKDLFVYECAADPKSRRRGLLKPPSPSLYSSPPADPLGLAVSSCGAGGGKGPGTGASSGDPPSVVPTSIRVCTLSRRQEYLQEREEYVQERARYLEEREKNLRGAEEHLRTEQEFQGEWKKFEEQREEYEGMRQKPDWFSGSVLGGQ